MDTREQTATLAQLEAELREQDEALRAAREKLAAMGEELVAVDPTDLAAIEEACSARPAAVARGWLGIRC